MVDHWGGGGHDPLSGVGIGSHPRFGLLIDQCALNIRRARRSTSRQIVAGVLHRPGGVQELQFQLGLVLKLLHRTLRIAPILTAGIGGKSPGPVLRLALEIIHGGGIVVAPHGRGKGAQSHGQHQQYHAYAVNKPAPPDTSYFYFIRDNNLLSHLSTSPLKSRVSARFYGVS